MQQLPLANVRPLLCVVLGTFLLLLLPSAGAAECPPSGLKPSALSGVLPFESASEAVGTWRGRGRFFTPTGSYRGDFDVTLTLTRVDDRTLQGTERIENGTDPLMKGAFAAFEVCGYIESYGALLIQELKKTESKNGWNWQWCPGSYFFYQTPDRLLVAKRLDGCSMAEVTLQREISPFQKTTDFSTASLFYGAIAIAVLIALALLAVLLVFAWPWIDAMMLALAGGGRGFRRPWTTGPSVPERTLPRNSPTPRLRVSKPDGIPENWKEQPSDKGGGTEWVNPENPNDRVRSMPGNPSSQYPWQQEPYVIDQNGGVRDVNGNRIPGSHPIRTEDAHIPSAQFKFRRP